MDRFPERWKTRLAIVEYLIECGGESRTSDPVRGWSIHREIGLRLGVPRELQIRPTKVTGEESWRPAVGFCRKDLAEAKILSKHSEDGIWQLSPIESWTAKGIDLLLPDDTELHQELFDKVFEEAAKFPRKEMRENFNRLAVLRVSELRILKRDELKRRLQEMARSRVE